MLDLTCLEKLRRRAGKLIARCPACGEMGADRSCEHLFIADEGRGPFGCVLYPATSPGPERGVHLRRIWELAGQRRNTPGAGFPATPVSEKAPVKCKPRVPALRPLTVTEMAVIAKSRGWRSFVGLELLTQRGLLWYGEVFDDGRTWPAWIVTDAARRNAQARRFNARSWSGIGGAKAKTLRGFEASLPVGLPEIGARPAVALCEGVPDFCAALFIAWLEGIDPERIAPVCITGAGHHIHPEALPYFVGKRVRIAVHADEPGRAAAKRWADQLWRAGVMGVDGVDFRGVLKADGHPVKDLADYAALLDPERLPSHSVFAGL